MKFVVPLTIPSTRCTFVGDERLAQHLDDGNRRADGRLEAQLHAGVGRDREEVGALARDELLVRGHDRLAGAEQLADVAARRLEPAHHLGDDVDRRVVADRREVGRQHAVGGRERRAPSPGPDERANDAQPVAGRALDLVAALGQHPVDRRADGAVAEECDADVN